MQIVKTSDQFLANTVLEMIEECSQMYQKRLADAHSDLEDSKQKVARLTAQEAALVQQNARSSVQLVAEEKKRYLRGGLEFCKP